MDEFRGRKDEFQDNGPSFLKINFGRQITEHTRIPPKFVKHLPKELPERAILRGPSGDEWPVKLWKTRNDIYLQDGWKQFYRDNSLGDNEFLLFKYNGGLCFDVHIFGKDACERVYVPLIKTNHETASSCGKRPVGRPRKTSLPSVLGKNHETASSSGKRPPGRPRKTSLPSVLHESKPRNDSPAQHILHDEAEQVMRFKEKDIRKRIKTEEKALPTQEMDSPLRFYEEKDTERKINTEDTDLPFGRKRSHSSRYVSRQKNHPIETKRSKVSKRVESFTSDLPYFETCMGLCSVEKKFIQHVPTRFARKHLPEQHMTKIILRNSEDKSCWEVIYVSRGRNRWFYRGWRIFVRDNKLKVGDTCIFELLAKNEMRVHIFRALRENSASCNF
ncbi:hypothetical protein CJ030_MR7G011513 [Morella rubra]|uniref:TF-B3 domain-containing protein n=1 Tax=Morella rubra TaxID=262757 RepID=A0A6A1V3A0_9ROSI|nr:hypothetical protein CJ030_MR7G011513 [Morella rubra]